MKSAIPFLLGFLALLLVPVSAGAAPDPLGFDRSFGVDGVASAPGGKYSRSQSGIAEAPGGKVVVGLDSPEVLLRFTANGSRDKSFGNAGYARLQAGGHKVNPHDVLVDRKGRATAFGASLFRSEPDTLYGAAIIRLERDGSVDRSFAERGLFFPRITRSFEFREAAFSPGGRVVAVARGFNRRSGQTLVARLLPNGRPDRTFSGDGFRLLKMGDQYTEATVAVDKRGRTVVGGARRLDKRGDHWQHPVVRLTKTGDMDESFGRKGRVNLRTGGGVSDLTVDWRGRVVVAGGTAGDSGMVLRMTESGGLDPSFSGDGVKLLPRLENPTSVSVDDNGRINVIGFYFDGFGDFLSIVNRMRSNGNFDPVNPSPQDCYGFCTDDFGMFGDHYLDSRDRLVVSTAFGKPTVIRLLNR